MSAAPRKTAPDRQADLFAWVAPVSPQSDPAVTEIDRSAGVARSHIFRAHCGVTSGSLSTGVAPPHFSPRTPQQEKVRGDGSGDPGTWIPAAGETAVAQSGQEAGDCGLPLRRRVGDPGEQEGSEPAAGSRTAVTAGSPTLRPYQVAALAGVRQALAIALSTVLVLATGCGKTVCFAELARETVARGKRVLVLAHRSELLKQARSKLTDVGVDARIEKAEQRAGNAPVVVASVQSLTAKRLVQFDARQFGLVVVDEGHHALAPSYRAVLEHFAGVPVLGVTATPDRADGKALGEVFSSVAYRYDLREAIRDKWLAPIRARRVVVQGLDLSSVKTRAGDLAQDELAAIMADEGVMQGVASSLFDQAGDRKTIAFCVDVAGAHGLAEMLNRWRPGCARAIDGSADEFVREQLLVDFAAGEFQFLCNCALYLEGFDEPTITCVVIARPTKSRALYTQMVGRGTRLSPGKSDCLVLDMVGNSGRHKLVGPIDALAPGAVSEDVYGEASTLLEAGDCELEEVLAEADVLALKRREEAKAIARAKYFAEEVDPFFGGETPLLPDFDGCEEPATDEQLRDLVDAGVTNPDGISRGDAKRMLSAIQDRRRKGLCSLKQAKLLKRFYVDTRTLTRDDAGILIGILERYKYNPRALASEMTRLESIKPRSWQTTVTATAVEKGNRS